MSLYDGWNDIVSGLKLANGRIATQRTTRDRDLSGRGTPCAGLLRRLLEAGRKVGRFGNMVGTGQLGVGRQ